MKPRPTIRPYDWIYVDRWTTALVTSVRDVDDPIGDCEVIFNSVNPISADVKWTGYEWVFRPGSYGENAASYERLGRFVRLLREGRTPPARPTSSSRLAW